MNNIKQQQRLGRFVGGLAFIVIMILLVVLSTPKTKLDEELQGEIRKISYIEVNLREEPSRNAKIITTLSQGDRVTLTGNKNESILGDDIWYEVSTEEETGWVIITAIDLHTRF